MFILYLFSFIFVITLTQYIWKRITFNIIVHFPCAIVALCYSLFGDSYGFKPLNGDLFIYLSLFLYTGFIIESSVIFSFRNSYNNIRPNHQNINVPPFFVYLIILISISILAAAYDFSETYGATSEDFEAKMASGIIGHSLIFLMITPPFIYLAYKNERITFKLFLMSVLLVFTCLFVKQVKSWIMIPIVYFVFMYLYYNKINKKKFILIGVVSSVVLFSLFFGVYYAKATIAESISDENDFLVQIYQHFLFYLFSGIGAFSEFLYSNINSNDRWYTLITPVINVMNYIMGEPMINVVNPLNYTINYEMNNASNVFTMFGTMWIYMGYWSLMFYSLIVAFLGCLSLKRNSILLNTIFWLISSFGFFSWFEYYYFHLAAYEAPIYVFILTNLFLVDKYERKNTYNNS